MGSNRIQLAFGMFLAALASAALCVLAVGLYDGFINPSKTQASWRLKRFNNEQEEQLWRKTILACANRGNTSLGYRGCIDFADHAAAAYRKRQR